MQPEPDLTIDPDPPSDADRAWEEEQQWNPSPEAYEIVKGDFYWGAWRSVKSRERGMNVQTLYPIGRYDSREAALSACRTDALRRHADREVNEVEAARAKVPMDDREAPERDDPPEDQSRQRWAD